MKICGSVLSLTFSFPHAPEDKKQKEKKHLGVIALFGPNKADWRGSSIEKSVFGIPVGFLLRGAFWQVF